MLQDKPLGAVTRLEARFKAISVGPALYEIAAGTDVNAWEGQK